MKTRRTYVLAIALLLTWIFSLGAASAQSPGHERQLKSSFGHMINPHGEYRLLNLFINILYDETPHNDPIQNPNSIWPAAEKEGINAFLPGYLRDFMDTDFYPSGGYGSMTRLYRESSFDRLILLGDFMVVNIRQSEIIKTRDRYFGERAGTFTLNALVNAAIKKINDHGGLNALYGHNSLPEYDRFTPAGPGLYKPLEPNGNIDFIQILTRNTTYKDTLILRNNDTISHRLQYGQLLRGQGWGNFKPSARLLVEGVHCGYDLGTVQCIGDGNISNNPANIIHHEFSHNLFGGNNFHASGGNHYTGGGINTFFGTEGGYGLMGSYHSGLVSCNGFERRRMNWTSPHYNPKGLLIQANQVPSDISRDDGALSFVLRDFVTTGDAIRIRLPNVDEGASQQYLWLENHQVGLNDKLDYLQYALDFFGNPHNACRHPGTPGIYAYIQVGKETLEGSRDQVFPWNETDNLRIVSAEGNWDFLLMEGEYSCVAYANNRRTELRYKPNPLAGYQDQTTHFFPPSGQDVIRRTDGEGIAIKYFSKDSNIKDDSYSFYGDSLDAFSGKTHMSIGTNPAPVNLTTFYVSQRHDGQNNHTPSDQNVNTSHIYLSGLRIDMEQMADGTFVVQVRWDDYELAGQVRWTGNIVLTEQLMLQQNSTLQLDQSLTPNQINRDPVSGLFAPPTRLQCQPGSMLTLHSKARMELKNQSTLHMNEGSLLELGHQAELFIGPGDTLKIEAGAKLILRGNAKIVVRRGGVLGIDPGTRIEASRGRRNFRLQRGHVLAADGIDPRRL